MDDGGHPSQRQDHEDSLAVKHHLQREPGGARKMLEACSGREEGCGTLMGAEVIISLEFPKVIHDSTSVPVVFSLLFNFPPSPLKPVLDKHFSPRRREIHFTWPKAAGCHKSLSCGCLPA